MKQKQKIKQNVRHNIITFMFMLALLLASVFILFKTNTLPEKKSSQIMSGTVVLREGTPVDFGNNEGTLLLIESTVGFPNCADCMETARVEVVKGNESHMLNYRIGGIAGFLDTTDSAFGYTFVVRELLNQSVTIEYTKEPNNL